MNQAGRRLVLAYLALFIAPLAPALADDTEQREFSIFIDGKEAGSSRMTLVQQDDGTTYMTATVDVKFRHLVVIDYVIKAETQEWWKDGRLVGMKTSSSDNGKKYEATVALDPNKQLRMKVNGKESILNADVWTNSYWRLADARFHNKKISIVEVDTGKEYTSELKYIGTEKVPVGKDFVSCYRFQVTAPNPVDLWFDKYHRLVRQEFTEQGHKTIVQLNNVKR